MNAYEAKARRIWKALRDRGANPVWCETLTQGDTPMIAIGFEFLSHPFKPWVKAFMLDAVHANPALFEGEIRSWKKGVRADMAAGRASGTVQQAIALWGRAKVDEVMA